MQEVVICVTPYEKQTPVEDSKTKTIFVRGDSTHVVVSSKTSFEGILKEIEIEGNDKYVFFKDVANCGIIKKINVIILGKITEIGLVKKEDYQKFKSNRSKKRIKRETEYAEEEYKPKKQKVQK